MNNKIWTERNNFCSMSFNTSVFHLLMKNQGDLVVEHNPVCKKQKLCVLFSMEL